MQTRRCCGIFMIIGCSMQMTNPLLDLMALMRRIECLWMNFIQSMFSSIAVNMSMQQDVLSRLSTHYLCRSSEGLDDGLELEVIDEEEEMGDGKASEAEDDGGKVG
jgi:hypothetical protein